MKKYFVLFLLIGFLISSCQENTDSNNKLSAEEIEKLSAMDTLKITLNSNDKMQFDQNEIIAWEGQTIELTLHHTGEMPKTSMGHNFVLISDQISLKSYVKKSMKAKENNYVIDDSSLTLASTSMIGGGESTTTTFKAPQKGEYDFLCTFQGHYSIMKEKFILK